MKTPRNLALAVGVFSLVSCQNPFAKTEPEPVPKVVTYQKPTKKPATTWKPKKTAVVKATPEVELEETISPLTPDPTNTLNKTEIPKFEVPENIQPKVADGIDQGAFIELRWTN